MIAMDVKGITWVGHFYQHFEAMCLEVEELVYKDTAQYVENQVETVGASVKKFCADVMEDLLPPSSKKHVKVAAQDLSTEQYDEVDTYKMIKSGKENKPSKFDMKLSKVKLNVSSRDEVAKNSLALVELRHVEGSSESSSGNSIKGEDYVQDNPFGEKDIGNNYLVLHMSNATNPMEKDLTKASSSSKVLEGSSTDSEIANEWMPDFSIDGSSFDWSIPMKSVGNKLSISRLSSGSGLSVESNDTPDNNGGISLPKYSVDNVDVDVSDPGRQCDLHPDAIEIEQTDKVCLEKSCVIVNGDELNHVPSVEEKHKPYKKIIRDAFSLRKRSSRKQEYEQIAVRYGNNEKCNKQFSENVTPSLAVKDENPQPEQDIGESDWVVL